jgi:hypothetical protein
MEVKAGGCTARLFNSSKTVEGLNSRSEITVSLSHGHLAKSCRQYFQFSLQTGSAFRAIAMLKVSNKHTKTLKSSATTAIFTETSKTFQHSA